MGWWPWGTSSASKEATAKQTAKLERKCRHCRTGLAGCRKANVDDPGACKNLEIRLVACFAEGLCKPDADEHRRCYSSLYKTGLYKGVGHCGEYEERMKACLRKQKLYPFP
ncbi:hypothetical protein TSOC_013703 [Tetrabaena socialis]|uniref:COX assembly mitochondrial protein n=1 Tax=Tetrabaena socialis TaxID=47790 RepID=A0A2J7ZJN3_9CHLO|nr:hypothetical protein TSOC_013703 [Tetrabaena socialis]|eukprot:PNH00472.1 hypothetical protein TSOC_013703 [Tetrabaena socialis]